MKSNGEAPRRICGTLYIVPTILRSYIPTFPAESHGPTLTPTSENLWEDAHEG